MGAIFYLILYHSKSQQSELEKEIVTLYRPTLVAVGPRTRGEQLHQLQALLTEGDQTAMAESALKSKGVTSEGQ